MSHKRLVIDLDGCLANFNEAYAQVLMNESGLDPLPPGWEIDPHWPPVWDWDRAFPPTVRMNVWEKRIRRRNTNFWLRLDPLPQAKEAVQLLHMLAIKGHEVYFLTAREGQDVKLQTEDWLLMKLGMPCPTVIISTEKHHIVNGLQPDLFVDDRLSTVEALAVENWKWPNMEICLVDRPYNRDRKPHLLKDYTVVGSVLEALQQAGLDSSVNRVVES